MLKIREFVTENGVNAIHIENAPNISLFKTFDCGQCFRFNPVSVFGNKYEVGGVALGRYVIFAQEREDELIVYNCTRDDFDTYWKSFLDLENDYDKINSQIVTAAKSEHMQRAVEYGSGIRILKQELWECMISFIISQNNNIPRIKKIVEKLCLEYGEKITFLDNTFYTFPTPEALSRLSDTALAETTKMGFRAKYVLDAARWFLSTPAPYLTLGKDPDYNKDFDALCEVKGIGPKVASCIMLFGLSRGEAFPIDVHIRRTLERYFPNGLDVAALGKTAGIAQQYLFYYEKYNQNT